MRERAGICNCTYMCVLEGLNSLVLIRVRMTWLLTDNSAKTNLILIFVFQQLCFSDCQKNHYLWPKNFQVLQSTVSVNPIEWSNLMHAWGKRINKTEEMWQSKLLVHYNLNISIGVIIVAIQLKLPIFILFKDKTVLGLTTNFASGSGELSTTLDTEFSVVTLWLILICHLNPSKLPCS